MSWQTFAICRTWFCTNHGLWIWVILEIYESGDWGLHDASKHYFKRDSLSPQITWSFIVIKNYKQLRGSMNVCYNIVCFFSCVNSTNMFWNELSYSSLSLSLSLCDLHFQVDLAFGLHSNAFWVVGIPKIWVVLELNLGQVVFWQGLFTNFIIYQCCDARR
jgi:hypothetical protein